MSLTPRSEKPVKEIELTKDLSVGLFADGKIMTMIRGEKFVQCRKAIVILKEQEIDDAVLEHENFDDFLRKRSAKERDLDNKELGIDPEVELFVHASTLQGWVESGYNIDVIDTRIAFPILLKLSTLGDAVAKKALFDEVWRRWSEGSEASRKALMTYPIASEVLYIVKLSMKGYANLSNFDHQLLSRNALAPPGVLDSMARKNIYVSQIVKNPSTSIQTLEHIVNDENNHVHERYEAIQRLAVAGVDIKKSTINAVHRGMDILWNDSSTDEKRDMIDFMLARDLPLSKGYVRAKQVEYYREAKENNGITMVDVASILSPDFDQEGDLWVSNLILDDLTAQFSSFEEVYEELEKMVVDGWDMANRQERIFVLNSCPPTTLMELVASRKLGFDDLRESEKDKILEYFEFLGKNPHDQYAMKKAREFLDKIKDDIDDRGLYRKLQQKIGGNDPRRITCAPIKPLKGDENAR